MSNMGHKDATSPPQKAVRLHSIYMLDDFVCTQMITTHLLRTIRVMETATISLHMLGSTRAGVTNPNDPHGNVFEGSTGPDATVGRGFATLP